MVNKEQMKGMLERVATVAVAWLVGKGYVPQEVGGDIIALVMAAGLVAWGFAVNRPAALDKAAKEVK